MQKKVESVRLLFITRLYYPHVGGVEKHIRNVCRVLLRKRGKYKITILTEKFDKNLKDKEIIDGVRIVRFSYPKIKFLGLLFIWFYMLSNINLIKRSDIIHIHDVFIWYFPFKMLFPRKGFFITFHGWEGKYPIPWTYKFQKRIAALLSSGSICIGKYISKYYGIKTDSISYGAVELPLTTSKKRRNLIVYVGRLDKNTGLLKLLRVFKKLQKSRAALTDRESSGFEIHFCGDGILRSKCERYGKVHGFVDPAPFYKSTKYVFTHGYLVTLESLANKCLVFVLYENPLTRDCFRLTPFRNFIVCEGSAEKLYKRFLYLESHPSKIKTMVEAGYNWAMEQTWSNLVGLYEKVWGMRS